MNSRLNASTRWAWLLLVWLTPYLAIANDVVDATPLTSGNANRNALYEAIYALQSSSPYKALEGTAALRATAALDAAGLSARPKVIQLWGTA